MSEATPGSDRLGRRPKRFLTPSQKYEIWLQLVRQEVTIAEAAADHQVDRSDDHADPHGRQGGCAGLSEALKETAVRLTLVEGKGAGAKWPGPGPGRRGHQDRPARAAR
jgi:transposase